MNGSSKICDILPPEMRKRYVKDRLQKGLVIKSSFPGIASYDKIYVLVAVDNNLKLAYGFFINSNPHPLSSRNFFIMRSQIELDHNNYDFLQRLSYIDCYEPYSIDFYDMVNALIESPSKICGQLSSPDLEKIINAIQNNPTLTTEQKTLLSGNLMLPPDSLT